MEASISTLFEGVRHERCLNLLFSLTEPDILKEAGFTDDEINIIKTFSLEKLHRQVVLKQYVAVWLIKLYFLFKNGISKFD